MADITTRIDKEVGIAFIALGGEVTAADVIGAAHALHDRPDWDAHYDVIWDGRGVTSLVIDHDDVLGMVDAKVERSVGKEVTIAVREIDHVMASLCALLLRVRGREAVVVASLEEALEELGLGRLPAALEPAAR